jgi:hypothetical protein
MNILFFYHIAFRLSFRNNLKANKLWQTCMMITLKHIEAPLEILNVDSSRTLVGGIEIV